jgi:hypothetical protein
MCPTCFPDLGSKNPNDTESNYKKVVQNDLAEAPIFSNCRGSDGGRLLSYSVQ